VTTALELAIGASAVGYADILEHAPDALIVADREGVIRLWNAAATRVFGHRAEAALGAGMDMIIPERFQEQHWTGFDHALETGELKYDARALPTRSMHADGRTIYIELTFALLRDASGQVAGVMAAARDITERWERERARAQRDRGASDAEAPR
jgi:PAS domain S-box-containing protein